MNSTYLPANTATFMEVLLFTTNIDHTADIVRISAAMNAIKAITRWTVDLDDCDKVLRIEATDNITEHIENILIRAGYTCTPMPY